MAAKFLFVYAIAALNLALGFAAARWLGRGPRSWPFAFRLPARQNSARQGPPETGQADELLPSAAPSRGPTNGQHSSDLVEQAAERRTESVATISGAVEQIIAQMERYGTTFEQFGRQLHDADSALGARELETAASKIDTVAQQALKQINTTMDRLKSLEADSAQAELRERVVGDLDAIWSQLNDSAVQLVILSFEPDALEETRERLAETSDKMFNACRQASKSFAGSLPQLETSQTDSG